MSLFKQVSILITIVFLLLFISIIFISFTQIKSSVEKSLYENIQNSVSSISLSITNANVDLSTIKTVLNASFDNGNYEKVIFKDLGGRVVFERIEKDKSTEKSMPSWFLELISIDEVSAIANISQSWRVLGTIEIFANRDIFYLQAYKMFMVLLITLSTVFILFLFLLFILFKFMLKPLKIIKKQSDGILNNEFIFQETIPFTTEFKSLTLSINTMITKIQNMFNHASEVLKRNKELLYVDELTGLYNRKYLVMKINEFLEESSINHSGFIISIVITRIDLLNKIIGYKKVDELFVKISKLIKEQVLIYDENVTVRLNAGEFVIILPRLNETDAKYICESFSENIEALLESVEDEGIKSFVGLCTFKSEKTNKDFFSKIDYTLCQSKLHRDESYFYLKKDIYNTRDDWRNIITSAITNDYFNLLYTDVVYLDSKKIVYKLVNVEIKTYDKDFKYSEFIAPAIELNLFERIYLKMIEKLLALHKYNEKVCIQIPSKFINNLPFEKLVQLFKRRDNFKNIVFELEEESFIRYSYNNQILIELLREYDFDIAVSNFMAISDDYSYLQKYRPEFIRVNKDFIETSENFDALKIIKNSLGIEILINSTDKN